MKKRNRIVSLLVCLTLLSGMMVTPASAESYLPEEKRDVVAENGSVRVYYFRTVHDYINLETFQKEHSATGQYFNVRLLRGGKEYATTSRNTCFYPYIRVDGATYGAYTIKGPYENSDHEDVGSSLSFQTQCDVVGGYAKLIYNVTNHGSTAKTFDVGVDCRTVATLWGSDASDVFVHHSEGRHKVEVLGTVNGKGKGMKFTNLDYEDETFQKGQLYFNILTPTCDAINYSNLSGVNVFTNREKLETVTAPLQVPYNRFNASYAWLNETVQPGETWSRYVLVGAGDLLGAPTLNGKDLIVGQPVDLTGTAPTQATKIYLQIGNTTYSGDVKNGKYTVSVNLPASFQGKTALVNYWAEGETGVSLAQEKTLNVLRQPAITLAPTSTTVIEDSSLNETWYKGFVKSSEGNVTHTNVNTASPGTQTVTYTAATPGFTSATANLSVNVLPLPAQLSQATASQSGKNYNLSATMTHTGGLNYTETGFVYGTFQNPSLNLCDGIARTSGAVNTKNGTLSATATGLIDGVTYYARAYAKTGDGKVIYGPQSTGFGLNVPSYGTFKIKNNNNNTFTIYREGGTGGTQKVYYRTVNGSAVGDLEGQGKCNFQHAYGVLTFNEGEDSKDVTVQEFGANVQYGYMEAGVTTMYSNANRTYQMEINKVEGGAIIDQNYRFATRNMGHDAAYKVRKSLYTSENERSVTVNNDNKWVSDSTPWQWHWVYFKNDRGYNAANGNNNFNVQRTMNVGNTNENTYLQATAEGYSYKIKVAMTEDVSGYQNIWLSNHEPKTLQGAKEDAHGDNTSIKLDFSYFGHAFYTARWEAGYHDKGSATGTFPSGSGLRTGQWKENYLCYKDNSRVSGDWVTFNKDETAHAWFAATGNGDILWHVTSCTDYVKLRDTTEPKFIDVAYMAREDSASGAKCIYLPGDPVTISLIFDEIVDSGNSSLEVGSSSITTNWGTFYYQGGEDTNVLYFTGTTPEGATSGIYVESLDCAGQIKDMAGNVCTGGTSSTTAWVASNPLPTVTVGNITNNSGTLTAQITATNAATLQYAWTQSSATPTSGWKSLTNKAGGTVTTRQGAGTWYLHARAANADGRVANDQKSYTIPAAGQPGGLVLPKLTASVDNSSWARSRDITLTPTPGDAAVRCIKGDVAAYSGNKFTVLDNGSYTFQINVDGDTATTTANVTKLDRTAPTVTIDPVDNSKTYIEPVTLTVRAADSESGLDYITGFWKKEGGVSESADFTKVSDGVYTTTCPVGKTDVEKWKLSVTAEDNVRNESSEVVSPAYTIDYRVPTITVTQTGTSNKGYTYSYAVAKGGAEIVSIDLPDGSMGINEENGSLNLSGTFTITQPGTYYASATDGAGRVAVSGPLTVPANQNIDGVPPEVWITPSTFEWTKGPLTATVVVYDAGSAGIPAAKQNNTALSLTRDTMGAGSYKGSFQITENDDYSVTATDTNGNVGTASIDISNIDNTAPAIGEPTGNPTDWTQNNATIAFNVSDTQSGMKTVTVKKGADNVAVTNTNGSCSFTAAENGEYTITATDNVGNTSTKTVKVEKIDKAEPTLTVSGGMTAAESLELTVTADAPGGSGITTTVKKPDNAVETVTGGKYTVTQSGTYTFTVTTGAGQTKSQTVNVYSVTFAETGDSTVPSQIVVSGGKVTEPTVFKEDYTLSGWKSGENAWNFDTNTVTGNTTLTAKWFVAPTANTLTYNGTAQELVTAGSTTAGELQYSLDGTNYSADVPTGTDAETYTVYYKIVEDGQSDTGVKTVEVTIAQKKITGTVTVSGTPTMAQTLTATYTKGEDQGETVAYQWYRGDDPISGATQTTYTITADDIGKTIKVKVSGTGNYTGSVDSSPSGETGKATPSVTTWPTAGAITYGQTLGDSPLTGGAASVAGTFTWEDGTIKPAVADSQNTEYKVVFTPNVAGYNAVEGKLTLTVNKANPVVSVSAIENLTYSGAAQALVTGTTSGGELQYSLDGTNYAPSIPTGKDAGDYTVFYKVIGGSNYNDVDVQTVNVTIARKPITGTVTISGKVFVEQTLTADYSVPDETISYQWYQGSAPIDGATQSTYTVVTADLDKTITVKVSGTGNYTGDVTSAATDAVGKVLPKITAWPTAGAITYGQTLADSTLTGGQASVAGTFAWKDGTIKPAVSDSGQTKYDVIFTPTDTNTYSSDTESITVTVNKAILTPSATADSKIYDGTAAATGTITLTGAVNGETPKADATFTFESPDAGEDKRVNVTEIALKDNWGDNYVLSTTELETTATISTKAFTDGGVVVTLGPSLTYTGEEQTQTIQSVTIGGLSVTGYTVSGNTGTDAKTYTLTVTGTGSFTGSVTKEFTIAKAGNEITNFTCLDIISGETPQPSAKADFGEIVYTYSGSETGPFNAWSGSEANGTWYVKASVAGTDNYAGAEKVISFKKAAQREETPKAVIDYFEETLTGLDAASYIITPAGGEAVNETVGEGGAVKIRDEWFGKTLSIIRKARDDSYSNSLPQSLPVPARPAAPAGPQAVNESILDKADGRFTGIDGTMEYKVGDGAWQDGPAALENQSAGTAVTVRLKATDHSFTGQEKTLTIAAGRNYVVTFNSQGGSAVPDQSSTGEVTKPDDPTKDHYIFSGWYTEASCVHRWDRWNLENTIADDLTLYAKWVEKTYSISGTVTDEENNPLSGVTVKLMQGNKQFGETVTTGNDGKYSFDRVSPGDYNVVAEQTVDSGKTKTMTKLVIITNEDKDEQNIKMPTEHVNSILEVKSSGIITPDVVVGGLDEEAKSEAETSSTVTITMTVESKKESDSTISTDVTAIRSEAGADEKIDFLAITVEKKVETKGEDGTSSTSETNITDTQNLMEIVIPYDFTGKSTVAVYRCHKNSAEALTESGSRGEGTYSLDRAGNHIYVYAQKFSTYAIGYTLASEEKPDPGPVLPGPSGPSGSSGSSGGGSSGSTNTAPAGGSGWNECPKDETCPISAFPDGIPTAWYHDGVHFCIEKDLMDGYANGLFGPDDFLTRAQLAQIIYTQAGRPAVSGESGFSDAAPNAWYAKAVTWARQNGVVSGYDDGRFGPDDNITREQLAVMLWRRAGSPACTGSLDRFLDRDKVSTWAADGLRWSADRGVVSGKTGGILDPTGRATRAEAAAMLQQFCTRAQN